MDITGKNIQIANDIYEHLPRWKFANEVLSNYFNKNRANASKEVVLIKVVLIDSLYYTNLKDTISMTEHIFNIKSLDIDLNNGTLNILEEISNWNNKKVISFASKFCHFHNRQKYPLFDKYVKIALKKLIGCENKDFENYNNFFEKINSFKTIYGLTQISFEDIDKYLWLYGQKEQIRQGKRDINKEILSFYDHNPDLFNSL